MNKSILLLKIEQEAVSNPLGLLYVGSYLKKHGYDAKAEIISINDFSKPGFTEKKAKEISESEYLFVGFSVLTGPQAKYSALLSQSIKKHCPTVPIVWGGIHPSLVTKNTLKEKYIDIVVIGEGEKTALELANAMHEKRDLSGTPGIGYKVGGKLIFNQPRPLTNNLDEFFIDWSIVDINQCIFEVQGRGTKGFIYLTSRGCPHNCSFCYNKAFSKRVWRTHSVERIIKDVKHLKDKYDIKTIAFMDDHFFVNKKRSFEILEKLKSMDIACAEFLLRVDEITEEHVKKLHDLGVKRIFVGVESGNDRVLSLMNKNTTRRMIIEKFKILAEYSDIAVNCAMIIGYPTETKKDIEDSIDLGIELSSMIPGIVVTYQTFLPFPGTDAYDLALREGFKPPVKTEDYENYDSFGDKLQLSWLPWASESTKKLFYRIDKYGKLLTHSKSTSLIRTFGKKFFYNLAKFRLKHRFFACPFEIFILFKFNRYYNPKCKI